MGLEDVSDGHTNIRGRPEQESKSDLAGSEDDRLLLSVHYLRGLAALMVVAYHIYSHGLLTAAPSLAFQWLKHGVAIFFVISGFVMVSSTSRSDRGAGDFLWRRLMRIAPLYWLVTLLWFLLFPEREWSDLVRSMLFFPTTDATTGAIVQPVLNVGWSLNFEMAFYLIFALSLTLPRSFALWAVGALLLVAAVMPDPSVLPKTLTYFLSPVLLEFVAGMAIAHLKVRAPAWCFPLALGALAFMPYVSDGRFLSVTLPATTIVASALALERRLPKSQFMLLLGHASYAIYLVHMFVIWMMFWTLESVLGGKPSALSLAVLPISVAMGIVVHRTVERPVLRFCVRVRTRRSDDPADRAPPNSAAARSS